MTLTKIKAQIEAENETNRSIASISLELKNLSSLNLEAIFSKNFIKNQLVKRLERNRQDAVKDTRILSFSSVTRCIGRAFTKAESKCAIQQQSTIQHPYVRKSLQIYGIVDTNTNVYETIYPPHQYFAISGKKGVQTTCGSD